MRKMGLNLGHLILATFLVTQLSTKASLGQSSDNNNADVNGNTAKGFPATGMFDGTGFDNVQVNNGNLHIEIPITTLNGRGDTITYKYVYNSKG
jgi:hypothetical protein